MKGANTGTSANAAVAAFSKQAPVFDELYGNDTIIRYKRKRVRGHVEGFLPPASHILELNAGTGEDAIYFADKGHTIHATDASPGMQEILAGKVNDLHLGEKISQELCSFTSLGQLQQRRTYDLVFSNFAGLNCTGRLNEVLDAFPSLVRAGGFVTLVILPRFCLWEFLLLFKGKLRTAFRRLAGRRGAKARVEGTRFRCWYYDPSYVIDRLKDSFDMKALEGLCTIVPPSYMEQFAEKNPAWYRFLVRQEDKWKARWPWRSIGDYYIITLQRKE